MDSIGSCIAKNFWQRQKNNITRMSENTSSVEMTCKTSFKDKKLRTVCSFVLVNPRTTVHPKKFDINVIPTAKNPRKIGRSVAQSHIVLSAKSSGNPLMVMRLFYVCVGLC